MEAIFAMAAELIGTTIGVVGFVGQLFDGCVKAYGYFTTARQLDTDSQRLMCKVRIEEMRLVVWGREWGVAEGKLEAHLESERNPELKGLATQVLEQLHSTVTDFKTLQERYGLINEAKAPANCPPVAEVKGKGAGGKKGLASPSPSRKGSKDEGQKTNGSKESLTPERGWRKEIGLRTKWVIGGTHTIPASITVT